MKKTSKKSTNPLLYSLALIPVLSSICFILSLLWAEDIYIFNGKILLISPIETPSIFGVLILIGYIVLIGFIGSVFAKNAVDIKKSVLIANIFPISCAVVYTLLAIIDNFAAADLSDITSATGGIGMGLMSIAGAYLYKLIPLNIFEVYIGLLLIIGVFIIGYSIGISKMEKK